MPLFTLPIADLEQIAASIASDADRLSGARFLIAGGTGFFGTWLIEGLLYASQVHRLDLSLDIVTRNPQSFAARMPHIVEFGRARLIHADVRTMVLPESSHDFVINAATESGGVQTMQSRLQMVETIVDGTRNLLRIALASGAKSVLYVSSGAVYGRRTPLDRDEIDEDYPGGPLISEPNIDHDESKRMAEALCRIYATEHDLPVKIARCFSFIGPYLPLDAHFAAGNFMHDALAGREIVVQGDGSAVRTYLYAADLSVWLLRILLDGKAGRAYNVAGKEPVSILDLARRAANCADPPSPVRVLGKSTSVPAPRIVASTKRAEEELGLRQTVGVEESLRKTFNWHRSRASS